MTSTGFFTQLFNQFVALISAFCIGGSVTPVPRAAPDPEPPGVVQVVDPAAPVPRNDFLGVVLDTQFNAAVVIGRSIAQSADRFTISMLRVPSDFADAVNRGGVAALPAGAAQSARRLILAAQDSAIGVVQAISDAALSELALVSGSGPRSPTAFAAAAATNGEDVADFADPAAVQRQPLLVRVVQTQVNAAMSIGSSVVGAATDLAAAVVAVPTTVMAAVARGGPAAIPAGLAAAAQRVAVAVRDGATGVIRSVGDAASAELDLIPGGVDTRRAAFVEQPPTAGLVPMLINTAVRLPLAVGVAAADLAVAGMQAAATVTGSVARAATDVVTAAVNPRSELTVGQALARAPATNLRGGQDAVGQLQLGVTRARTDFRNTLNPREVATRVSATGGLNTTVNGSDLGANTAALTAATSSGSSGSNGSNAAGITVTPASGASSDGTAGAVAASGSTSGDNGAEGAK